MLELMLERILLSSLSLLSVPASGSFRPGKTAAGCERRSRDPEWKAREALIGRAKVFVHPDRPISSLDLSRPPNDPNPLDPGRVVDCRYVPKPIKATTPKFDCELPNGDVIKVKYGRTPERPGEAAATRLLAALGFWRRPRHHPAESPVPRVSVVSVSDAAAGGAVLRRAVARASHQPQG
jgi:hypothetical protein